MRASSSSFTRVLSRAAWIVSVLAVVPTLPLAVVVVLMNGLVGRRRRPRLLVTRRRPRP